MWFTTTVSASASVTISYALTASESLCMSVESCYVLHARIGPSTIVQMPTAKFHELFAGNNHASQYSISVFQDELLLYTTVSQVLPLQLLLDWYQYTYTWGLGPSLSLECSDKKQYAL